MTIATPIQILLVEDDELFRLGLSTRLQQEQNLLIVAEAEDGEAAIALVKQQPFDLVILDIGLPGIGGLEACRQMKEHQPNLPILVLTSQSQPSLIANLLEAKAQGYCVKGIDGEALILAIRSVAAGATWWDATASREIHLLVQENRSNTSVNVEVADQLSLTRREKEILSLIAIGKTNQEIATMLYISTGTVRVHVHTILQKLDLRDRTQAAIFALQQGIISL
ncbi:response regulator transcription factor [Synechococcus elongatus IITB7]|uniref:response regulator transcription factor n=1 Tax=Synechococcus elongatus TaxID=32046 RepID=UPI0030CC57E1